MTLEVVDTGLRTVTFLELLEVESWRIKLYGMAPGDRTPPEGLVSHAKELIRGTLPRPARDGSRPGVGFATVHAGEQGDYVLVDWWEKGDLLKHHLFGAPHPHNGKLQHGWPQGVAACVWELAVPWFERNAWARHVILKPQSPDFEAYLDERLEGTV